MRSSHKPQEAIRLGQSLQIGDEPVYFRKYLLSRDRRPFQVQHRLFLSDPWELMGETIHTSLPRGGRARDIAQSFRRQAEDYYRAAASAREIGVRPVLFYYAFLNLAKAYAITRGGVALADSAVHGISCEVKPRSITGLTIRFPFSRKPRAFQELLNRVDAGSNFSGRDMSLGHLLPQIIPGHRLWCDATRRPERFLTIERFGLFHSLDSKSVWLVFYIDRQSAKRLGMGEYEALSLSGFSKDFDIAVGLSAKQWICFQQRAPYFYASEPAEALWRIIEDIRNRVWETVRIVSPYRKPYIYCCPTTEGRARLPQLASIYLLMFVLGYVSRYSPGNFEFILDSKFGPFFQTFISESPIQFLYLMASEILGREVSKPAIV